MATIGFDTSALDLEFKAHAARGIGRYVQELRNFFDSVHETNLDIRYFDYRKLLASNPLEKAIELIPFGKVTLRQQFINPFKLRWSGSFGYDGIHFPAHMDAPAWSLTPYIVTVLDLIPLVLADLYRADRPTWKFKLARGLELRAIRNAALVLAISEHTAKDVHAILGVPYERIVVTPLGVDESFFANVDGPQPALREALKIPPGREIILYVGGIDPRKNFKGLLEVLKRLRLRAFENSETPPVLVMTGKIEQDRHYPALAKLIKEMKLSDDVVLTGYLADQDLIALCKISAVFLFLSLYEGFGLTPLEAMAAGVPVVSSDRSCMPEVLGDAAFYVDPEDFDSAAGKVWDLYHSFDLQARLREAGLKRARLFSWQRTGELTLAAYRRFFEAGQPAIVSSEAC